jgi:hypothetical protein
MHGSNDIFNLITSRARSRKDWGMVNPTALRALRRSIAD